MLLSLGVVIFLNYASLVVHVSTQTEQEPLLHNVMHKFFFIPLSLLLLITTALFKITNDIYTKETELINADIPLLLLWINVLTDYARKWNVYHCQIAQKKTVRVMMIQVVSFIFQNWYFTQRNITVLWILHAVQGVLLLMVALGLMQQRRVLYECEDAWIEDRYKYILRP